MVTLGHQCNLDSYFCYDFVFNLEYKKKFSIQHFFLKTIQ